jgi:hypothetical protein
MTKTTLVRKSLNTLLHEAADAQGIALRSDISKDGRLVYILNDNTPVTPGEAADKLGVVWR